MHDPRAAPSTRLEAQGALPLDHKSVGSGAVDILLIAPEISPYSRSGEVADVCAALPKGLRSVGHKVTVISPLWSSVDPGARALARRLSGVEIALGSERYSCTIHDGRTTGGVELVFVGQPELFGSTPDCTRADLRAALVFCQAAAQIAGSRMPAPEVVHAHGYFAAAALPLLAGSLPAAVRVLSLHDVRERGPFAGKVPEVPEALRALTAGPDASLLGAGVAGAQRVLARSPTEAAALLQGDAHGLRAALEGKLTGIANGLDAARWNPLTDPLLPARYDAVSRGGKAQCKAALQLELGLPVRPEAPVVGCVLGAGEAARALGESLTALLRNDMQLVLTGSGAESLASASEHVQRYPERLAVASTRDERSQHRTVAGADLLLVLGADGELHLAAQRYGALPIAPDAAPVCDAIVDCDASLTTGMGFLYAPGSADELASAVTRALAAYTKHEAFAALQQRVMRLDLSWERTARSYEHAYKTLAGPR
jgi:starch synthase